MMLEIRIGPAKRAPRGTHERGFFLDKFVHLPGVRFPDHLLEPTDFVVGVGEGKGLDG